MSDDFRPACPDCKGKGKITLLISVVPCTRCQGAGMELGPNERVVSVDWSKGIIDRLAYIVGVPAGDDGIAQLKR